MIEQADKPTVSIIATFYNVADYAQACIDSICAQTYGALEILLVDDGSTDDTPAILDSAANDARVKVFHTPNGGPAAARNFGVAQAQGDYIAFVDGDDFVAPSYIAAMMRAAEAGCDYVAIGSAILKEGDNITALQDNPNAGFEAVPKDVAVEMLLYDQITESPWAKLFARGLVLANPFPGGRYYEDVAIAGSLLLGANSPAVIDAQLYGYRMRLGSVVHREQASIKQAEDFLWAIRELIEPIAEARPDLPSAIAFRYLLEYSRLHSVLVRVADDARRARQLDDFVVGEMQELLPIVRRDADVSLAQKGRFGLLATNRRAYDAAFGMFEAVRKGVVRKQGNQAPDAIQPIEPPTGSDACYLTHEEVQHEILELLKVFDGICKRHGLRYSLAGGTLLGAVRHQGFIPWDDDIDINMPRPDFKRFLQLRDQIERETGLLVERCLSDVDDPLFMKLTTPDIFVKERYSNVIGHLWIDLFPMDGFPASDQETESLCRRVRTLRTVAQMSYADLSQGKTLSRRIVKNAFRPVDKLLGIGGRCEAKLVSLVQQIPFGSTGYVGGLAWGYGTGERIPDDAYDEMVMFEFEGLEFPAIKRWKEYLTGLFGDYMQLPPESERVGHEALVWRASEPGVYNVDAATDQMEAQR